MRLGNYFLKIITYLIFYKYLDLIQDDLNGIFAFCLYDEEQDAYLIGRDHIGIIPLYTGHDEHGNFYVASELKALSPICKHIEEFPPGHFLWSKDGQLRKYYSRDWQSYDAVKDNEAKSSDVKEGLEAAVNHRQGERSKDRSRCARKKDRLRCFSPPAARSESHRRASTLLFHTQNISGHRHHLTRYILTPSLRSMMCLPLRPQPS